MKIGIIGCGNIGQALLKGIAANNYITARDVLVNDKDKTKLRLVRLRFKATVASSNFNLARQSRVVILAVKPQDVDTVLKEITSALKNKLLISVCAGISISRLEQAVGQIAVARVMPNMPAQIGRGVTAITMGSFSRLRDKRLVKAIFSCIGETLEVAEGLMDAVTAISGSGPAYFFYLTQTLISAAKELGIPADIARKLAVKTASGSAMLLEESKQAPEILRKQVTSKGGTTEAAFKVFRKKGLENTLRCGFFAAAKRSRQLRKEK